MYLKYKPSADLKLLYLAGFLYILSGSTQANVILVEIKALENISSLHAKIVVKCFI